MTIVVQRSGFRDATYSALGAGLVVALGAVPALPVGVLPVPITLQSFGVMLIGLLLSPRRAAGAILVVIGLVAMGLPVLSGGRGGLGVLVGPTAGYLYGWMGSAFLIAVVTRHLAPVAPPLARGAALLGACLVAGVFVDHLCGVLWLSLVTGIGAWKAVLGTLAFLPGDLLKAVIAVVVYQRIEDRVTFNRN